MTSERAAQRAGLADSVKHVPSLVFLATILVLLIIVVAVLAARKRRKRSRSAESPAVSQFGAPALGGATPREEAWAPDADREVLAVAEDLRRLAGRAGALDHHVAGHEDCEAAALLSGARAGLSGSLAGVRNLRGLLLAGDPRLNAIGLYNGLRTSDCEFWRAAKALGEIGDRLRTISEECAGEQQKYDDAGAALQGISADFYLLVASVHRLGWALGLE